MRQRPWVWVLAGFVVTILGATLYINRVNSSHPAPWPMALGDAAHRSASQSVFPASQPKVLWAYRLEEYPVELSSPVVWTDGTIFVSDGTKVVAVGPDGARRWSWDSQNLVHSLALGRRGELYVHSGTTLYALEQDGSMVWQLPMEISDRSALPIIVGQGGVIYLGNEQMLYAVGSDGKTSWRFKADHISGGPVETTDGRILLMVGEQLYVLDHQGDTVWHRNVASGPYQVVAGANGYIYVKGEALQVFDEKGDVVYSGTADRTTLSVALGKNFMQHGLRRTDLASEKQIWDATQGQRSATIITVDKKGRVLAEDFGANNGRVSTRGLHLLDADGKELWTFMDAPPVNLAAVTGDGRICYVTMISQSGGNPALALVCLGEK
jgi:outer membrane protein assembly factor BamB